MKTNPENGEPHWPHQVRNGKTNFLYFEFKGQVPRVGEAITWHDPNDNDKDYTLVVTNVLWNQFWPALKDGTFSGHLHSIVYVREVESIYC